MTVRLCNTLPGSRSEQGRKKSVISKDDGVCRRCGGDTRGGLVPCICVYREPVKFESGAWFLRKVQHAISLMPWSISTDKLEQIEEEYEGGESSSSDSHRELRSVREFLEVLSAKLAGGPLEGTRVAPLYDHPAYTHLCERYHASIRDALASLGNALRDALTRKPRLQRMLCVY
ncbi:hypothetical protein O0L34_g14836 [Tuta absoluta]|nr:hypothetical protein O0L34_g14836 [Tuta absoluta]